MGRVARETGTPRRLVVLVVLVLLLGVSGVLGVGPLAGGPAGALTPIEPDNRPTVVAGASNGLLPASLLLQIGPTCVAHRDAGPSLAAMIGAAAASGVTLTPSQCYRDLAGQQYWRAYYCGLGACQLAAVPGTSNHGWGKAVDLKDQSGGMSFTSPGYTWMKLNAWRYGWNHPGWAEPGQPAAEPWHWEWVGDGGTKYPGLVYPTPMGSGIVIGGNPIGSFDGAAITAPGRLGVSGWTIDPDQVGATRVHVYVDGARVADVLADRSRPDLAGAYPIYGPGHGFGVEVPAPTGVHEVCVFAINAGLGNANPRFPCRTVLVAGDPIGSADGVDVESSIAGATVHARGWALDPDTRDPIPVHGYLDGVGTATVASTLRADVGLAFPTYGAAHGFDWRAPAGHGAHQLCLYAINAGPGQHTPLTCRTVVVDRNPVGSLDSVSVSRVGVATVAGWDLDPDTPAALATHLYVDGAPVKQVAAGADRPDVGATFPAYGPAHGFVAQIPLGHGPHSVCAYAINAGAGSANPLLGCRTVVVDLNPLGVFEAAQPDGPGAVAIHGWVVDPDSLAPSTVHVYVDGQGPSALLAGLARPDVATAFPGFGPAHGFAARLVVGPGPHRICTFAINAAQGAVNPMLGCATVVT